MLLIVAHLPRFPIQSINYCIKLIFGLLKTGFNFSFYTKTKMSHDLGYILIKAMTV